MTFTQLTTRLKNFLRGWMLVLGLKEGLVECATVCVKSEVILLLVVDFLHSMVHSALFYYFMGHKMLNEWISSTACVNSERISYTYINLQANLISKWMLWRPKTCNNVCFKYKVLRQKWAVWVIIQYH